MNKRFLSQLIISLGICSLLLIPMTVFAEEGTAVHYSNKFQGRKTASGEIFDQKKLTAAHKQYPFGTKVRVTNLENNRSVIVKINDRMATKNSNIIDVTSRAANELGFRKKGKTQVSLEAVD